MFCGLVHTVPKCVNHALGKSRAKREKLYMCSSLHTSLITPPPSSLFLPSCSILSHPVSSCLILSHPVSHFTPCPCASSPIPMHVAHGGPCAPSAKHSLLRSKCIELNDISINFKVVQNIIKSLPLKFSEDGECFFIRC